MTYEMIQDIASEVINEAEFAPGRKLFDLDPDDYFDEYCVADSDCADNTLDFVNDYENNKHVIRATPIMVGDYLHLTDEQHKEIKQYMELEKTKHPYYNYVVTKIFSQR